MPRYLVQRTFPEPPLARRTAADLCREILAGNSDEVTWLHSYVSDDGLTWLCTYDARTPEAIRTASLRSALPVRSIVSVHVLDPYSYRDLEERTR